MQHSFRPMFPVSQLSNPGALIYLNSGTHSICPVRVTQSVCEALKYIEKNPTANLFAAWERIWEVQSRLGAFLSCRPDDLFLRSSVTAALSDLLMGIRLKAGEILHSDMEYGAIANICRFRSEQQADLSLRPFHIPSSPEDFRHHSPESLARLVIGELRPETRCLLVSHVMTGTGLKLPIRAIARETRKRGILLIVDGAHAPGAFPLDFTDLEDVDCYAGSLHKWMMAPKGTAFGWVPERNHALLTLRQPGWTTYELPSPFKEYGQGTHGFAARFLLSTSLDFAPFLGILETLNCWKEWTPEKVHLRLAHLQSYLEERMEKQGPQWPLASPLNHSLRGPLLSFELPDKFQPLGFDLQRQLLNQHNLQIAVSFVQSRWVLRLSPHVYNDEAEIDRAVDILTNLTQ